MAKGSFRARRRVQLRRVCHRPIGLIGWKTRYWPSTLPMSCGGKAASSASTRKPANTSPTTANALRVLIWGSMGSSVPSVGEGRFDSLLLLTIVDRRRALPLLVERDSRHHDARYHGDEPPLTEAQGRVIPSLSRHSHLLPSCCISQVITLGRVITLNFTSTR